MLQQRRFHVVNPINLLQRCQYLLRCLDYKLYLHSNAKDNDVDGNMEKSCSTRESMKCDFQLHKSRGQHLLTNTRILDSIVKKSNIETTDTVLEIGPGTGNLTVRLLEAARKVVAIEIDPRMAEALQKRVSECRLQDRLTLIQKDALETDFPKFDIVVANIPYNISSPLIAKLVFGSCSFRSATLLLQKEFAQRLLANPGDSEFNRLAVNVKLVAEVEHILDVSKREFFPVPRVDSSVVVIRPKAKIPNVDLNEWCAFTRTCFCKKNKTLGATFKQKKKLMELMRLSESMGLNDDSLALQHGSVINDESEDDKEDNTVCGAGTVSSAELGMSSFKEKVIETLRSSGFEDKRPSKLSVDELLNVLSLFNENKIYFDDQRRNVGRSNVELAASLEPSFTV